MEWEKNRQKGGASYSFPTEGLALLRRHIRCPIIRHALAENDTVRMFTKQEHVHTKPTHYT